MSALPALVKTYSCRANVPFQSVASALTMSQSLVWSLVAHMLDTIAGGTVGGTRHANSVWVVKSSSNSITMGTLNDGVNRWTTFANCIFDAAGTAHSWIHLENASIGLQCVVDCNPLAATSIGMAFSEIANPFTGGSITNRPLSSTEFCYGTSGTGVNATAAFCTDQVTGNFNWTHYVTTDDGRFFFLSSRTGLGLFSTFCGLVKTVNPPAGDTRNLAAIGHSINTTRGCPAYGVMNTALAATMRNVNGTICTTGGIQLAGTFGASVVPGAVGINAVTGNYDAFACHYYSVGTQPAYRGLIPDIQFITQAQVGASIPSAAAQLRIVAGDMIIPFPTVNPIV